MNRICTALRLDHSDAEEGLTLVEVVVAMMIFSIISISVAFTITNSLVLTRGSQDREIAANLAAQTIDLYRSYDDVFDVEDAVGSVDKQVSGKTFHIATSGGFTQATSTDTSTTICSAGTGALQYFHVTVAVRWDGMGASAPVYSDTDIAPNSRINNNTQGTIIVDVTGASGSGTSGITVSAASKSGTASPLSVTTDAKGCAYLLKVDPGDYNVSISKTGYLDVLQASAPSKLKTVKAGASVAASFTYDLAASYPLGFPNNATIPSDLTMTYVSTIGGVYNPTTTTNPTPLFPFSEGYSILAGTYVPAAGASPSCLSPDPGSWSTKASDGATGKPVDKVAAQPGQTPSTGSVSVGMGVVKVTGYTKGWYLTAVSTSAPASTGDPGCSISKSYSFPKTTATSGSGTNSGTMTIALPFGSWYIYQGSSAGATSALLGSSNFSPQTRTSSTLLSGLFMLTLDPRSTS